MKMNTSNDDIWYEIFLRLPLNSISKFKSVSKVWFSILSSPNFINHWYKLNNLSLPWVFFNNSGHLSSILQIAYPELHSRFISDHESGFSFGFLNQVVQSSNDVYLLGSTSNNGLVLCTTELFRQINYYVCNPLTRKWAKIPPPPTEQVWVVAGFVWCSESASFKVIRIPQFAGAPKEFKVEMFCSTSGEWNIYHVSCPAGVVWDSTICDNFVAYNGVLYWFQQITNKIVAVSVDKDSNHGTCGNECWLINVPDVAKDMEIFFMSQCLGESEGLLCFARLDKEKSLSVWVLDGDWCILHKDIKLHDWSAEIESHLIGGSVQVVGFSPVDKNVVLLSCEEYFWSYNTETREYEQLCHPSFLRGNLPSVPHLKSFPLLVRPRPTLLPPVLSE